jgi:Cytochrome c
LNLCTRSQLFWAALLLVGTASAANAPHGKTIFQTNCAGCHGVKAQGKVGPRLSGEVANWTPTLFQRALYKSLDDKGVKLRAPIPLWSKVGFASDKGKAPTLSEMQGLQAYLKTLR